MKRRHEGFTRASIPTVRNTFVVFAIAIAPVVDAADTDAEDPAVAELTRPTSRVEFGLGTTNSGSAKFGEYNGLGRSSVFGIGNVEVLGGGAYDSNDATRWSIRGNNLGLENRDLAVDYGVQGKFRLNFGYGELLHNLSDSFQTPYRGGGTNNLTLPSNWQKPIVQQVNVNNLNFRVLSPTVGPAGSLTFPTPTPAQLATGQGIRNADLPAFHEYDLKTKRKIYDGGFGYNFDRQWELTWSVRHETKNGAKPIGAISTKSTFESTVILPDAVDTSTDQFNLALNYTGDKSFMQAAYYGVMYRNYNKSLTWQDPSNLALSSTQSSSSGPDSQFHQLNLTGGYNLSPSTKLVMNGSYGRNTQDDAFLNDSQLPLGLPRSSLDGLVVTKGFNLKLTSRPVKGLSLVTGYKFDDRDNRTPVNTYVFYDINVPKGAVASAFNTALGQPAGTLANNINIYNNRPFSKRVNQFNLNGDYAVTREHTLAAGYEFQKIDRHCNGTWIECVDANTTKENSLGAEWRARLTEDVSSKVGYTYSRRTVDYYNADAWLALAPMANVAPGAPTPAPISVYSFLQQTGLTGWGPISGFLPAPAGNAAIFTPGNNIVTSALYGSRNQLAENPGMRRFNLADRNRDKFRSSLNWEASEKLSLYGGADFNQDDYQNSPLGLQNAKSWALNLDATYLLSDGFAANLFYSYEDQRSQQAGWNYVANAAAGVASTITGGCYADTATKNLNNKIDACNAWTADSRDRVDTLGLAVRHKNLMGGKLDVGGSFVYSRARTDIGVRGGNYATIPGTTNLVYIPATDLPTVNSNSIELRLSGQYALDKSSSVRLLYAFKRLRTADFANDGAQAGTLTTVMPSYEQSPKYSVYTLGISYVHNFR